MRPAAHALPTFTDITGEITRFIANGTRLPASATVLSNGWMNTSWSVFLRERRIVALHTRRNDDCRCRPHVSGSDDLLRRRRVAERGCVSRAGTACAGNHARL